METKEKRETEWTKRKLLRKTSEKPHGQTEGVKERQIPDFVEHKQPC